MRSFYRQFLIRDWQKEDRDFAAAVIRDILQEYGLPWQPESADKDVVDVENAYWKKGGEFWVVEQENQIVGTAAYHPISRGEKAVEIRKMYLLPVVRRIGLGQHLLTQLETKIATRGFREIWIETVSVLQEAIKLYESNGYQPATGIATDRCDLIYVKRLSLNEQR